MSDYTYEPTRNEQLTVTNTSQVIFNQKSDGTKRKSFVIRNTGVAADILTIHIGSGLAVANRGIVLKQGETYFEATDQALECWQGEITIINAVASALANCSIFER